MKQRWLLVPILLACAGCLLIPDDQETGTRVPNIRPLVRITAGAATADSAGVDYKVNFQWRGADQDGMVIRFQYATDDTTTEAAWTDTTAFGALLRFPAGQKDPRDVAQTFSDWHTFYIRAVDNEYAVSSIDKRQFNARTIAPLTRITFPRLAAASGNLVRTFNVEWEGEDLDSSAPEKTPAHYEYKLIKLASGFIEDAAIVDSLLLRPNAFLDTLRAGDKTRWIRVSGEQRELLLRDLPLTQSSEVFVFSIRAVDEAGAVEPVLERGENWIIFHVQDIRSQPYVTVTERSLGRHVFPRDGEVWYIEVPSDTPVRFRWSGDADYYGSKAGDVNYGMDVPDPQDDRYRDPRGIGGWIGWGKYTGVVTPLIFPATESGQQHVFYIRMMDAGGLRSSERLCTIVMTVVAFTFSRPALLVDDAKVAYGLGPVNQDAVHDAFIDKFIGRIRDFTGGELDVRSMYAPRGQYNEGLNPTVNRALKLSDMALYSTILWSFNFAGGETSGIWFHEREAASGQSGDDKRMLSSYLAAGGKLFLFGGRPISAIISRVQGAAGGDYPKLPPQAGVSNANFTETSFIWRFLHVRNMVVGIDPLDCTNSPPNDHQSWRDGLTRCVSRNPAYPDLYIDPAKFNGEVLSGCEMTPKPPTGGLRDYEGILFDRRYSPFYPEAGLDTLYTSETYNWIGGPPSYWGGSVIAQRYESTQVDTLRGNAQGRVVLFLFQPYPFYEGPAVDAGTAAINWLIKGQDY
ncbi:MAG: hypothetical protein FJY88_01520 [Candidatus Eisenbacteria bacterium]|nr:hypothetical protein [Candidatus Eisenbacteria bacterium]